MQTGRALGSVRGVLLDLSGTLHVETTPTPSAVASLDRLSSINANVYHRQVTCKVS